MKRWWLTTHDTRAQAVPESAVAEAEHTLAIMNVHLHCSVARVGNGPNNSSQQYVDFWNRVAELIVRFGVRLLAGDFNMSLFAVVAELRRRGVCVNVAAWYCWLKAEGDNPVTDRVLPPQDAKLGDKDLLIDSVGIFVIGPLQARRLPFYQNLFGWDCKSAVAEPNAQRQFQHFVDPKTGKPLKGPAPYLLPEYECKNGSCGHQLASYRPNDFWRKTVMINAFSVPSPNPPLSRSFKRW